MKKTDLWKGVFLMLICVSCLCAGQFIWKRFDGIISLAAGFAFFAVGALSMLSAYRFGNLSVLQPINSLSVVISAFLGAAFFQEVISPLRMAGIVAIMAGVVILTRGERKQ